MFFYVFESSKWIQTEKIYPHDIALILNPEKKEIYHWIGPKSLLKIRNEADDYISQMTDKFPQFKFVVLDKKISKEIQSELDAAFDKSFESIHADSKSHSKADCRSQSKADRWYYQLKSFR